MNINLNFKIEPVFLDLEPLDNKPCSPIIELSIVNVHGDILFDEYICPGEGNYLSNYKINVLNFDEDKLANAKELSYYMPCLKELTNGKAIVTYGKSDIDKLPWLKEHSIYLDCCQRFSERYGSYSQYHANHTWVSLANACLEIDYIPNGIVHRSLTDAESCRNVWLHLDKEDANFNLPIKRNYLKKNSNIFELSEVENEQSF